jgi:excisionase family DNA binding protein
MQTYQTISGRTLDLTGTDAPKIAFLERIMSMAEAGVATRDQMIALAYGTDNPILDPNVIPGRGAVTAAILHTPAYRVMTDILFRKEVADGGTPIEELANQFTLTPAEAAERLGVHVSAVRQAIDAGRLGAWMKGGRVFIDPRSLATLRLSPRGPKAKTVARASNKPLEFRAGTWDGKTLHIRFAGQPDPGAGAGGTTKSAEGIIAPWRRVGVFTGAGGRARFVVLTPSTHEETIAFGHFYVRGAFEVAEKINSTKAAKQAWQKFMPA